MRVVAAAVLITSVVATPVAAQWLNRRTPDIPRTVDGKPALTAPTPRTQNGRPDLAGLWSIFDGRSDGPAAETVLPWAGDAVRLRLDNFLKDRPSFRCRPSGPEPVPGWKRIVQTPTLIAILNDDLTYRQIFMDGRELERDPSPTWMGYSVGRWDGDTLVVESNGFNDQTWLHFAGWPHTEALHMTERFRRRDFGHIEIDVTIKQLRAMSRGLRHAAACPAPSHAECPTFQRLLKAAASGALEKRRRSEVLKPALLRTPRES